MDVSRLKESVIDLNCNNKLYDCLEYYKTICIKIILACETSLFKNLFFNNQIRNINNSQLDEVVKQYVNFYNNYLQIDGCDENIDEMINKIIELTDNKRNEVIGKIFYIIDHFYNFLDRNEIEEHENLNEYQKMFYELLPEYFSENTLGITDIINQK